MFHHAPGQLLTLENILFHTPPFFVQCLNQPSLEVVHMLVELYPKAVEEHDKIGRLPLHLACSNHASFDVVEYIVEKYPEGVIELTDRGVSPYLKLCLLLFRIT
jgi:hypothetical protein